MASHRYSLPALRRHTRRIRADAAPLIEGHQAHIDAAVRRFDAFVAGLDSQSDQLRKNVRKVLATAFFNHWYSTLTLIESGLFVDAVVCERAALEALAFHWLVCVDPTAVDDYHSGRIPRPVVVRRRLEALGVDIAPIREGYSAGSAMGHVGRHAERFHIEWLEPGEGQLRVGGSFRRDDMEHWLSYLPALLDLFAQPTLAGPASSTGDV